MTNTFLGLALSPSSIFCNSTDPYGKAFCNVGKELPVLFVVIV